jgi:hypothetical protein
MLLVLLHAANNNHIDRRCTMASVQFETVLIKNNYTDLFSAPSVSASDAAILVDDSPPVQQTLCRASY